MTRYPLIFISSLIFISNSIASEKGVDGFIEDTMFNHTNAHVKIKALRKEGETYKATVQCKLDGEKKTLEIEPMYTYTYQHNDQKKHSTVSVNATIKLTGYQVDKTFVVENKYPYKLIAEKEKCKLGFGNRVMVYQQTKWMRKDDTVYKSKGPILYTLVMQREDGLSSSPPHALSPVPSIPAPKARSESSRVTRQLFQDDADDHNQMVDFLLADNEDDISEVDAPKEFVPAYIPTPEEGGWGIPARVGAPGSLSYQVWEAGAGPQFRAAQERTRLANEANKDKFLADNRPKPAKLIKRRAAPAPITIQQTNNPYQLSSLQAYDQERSPQGLAKFYPSHRHEVYEPPLLVSRLSSDSSRSSQTKKQIKVPCADVSICNKEWKEWTQGKHKLRHARTIYTAEDVYEITMKGNVEVEKNYLHKLIRLKEVQPDGPECGSMGKSLPANVFVV